MKTIEPDRFWEAKGRCDHDKWKLDTSILVDAEEADWRCVKCGLTMPQWGMAIWISLLEQFRNNTRS